MLCCQITGLSSLWRIARRYPGKVRVPWTSIFSLIADGRSKISETIVVSVNVDSFQALSPRGSEELMFPRYGRSNISTYTCLPFHPIRASWPTRYLLEPSFEQPPLPYDDLLDDFHIGKFSLLDQERLTLRPLASTLAPNALVVGALSLVAEAMYHGWAYHSQAHPVEEMWSLST